MQGRTNKRKKRTDREKEMQQTSKRKQSAKYSNFYKINPHYNKIHDKQSTEQYNIL